MFLDLLRTIPSPEIIKLHFIVYKSPFLFFKLISAILSLISWSKWKSCFIYLDRSRYLAPCFVPHSQLSFVIILSLLLYPLAISRSSYHALNTLQIILTNICKFISRIPQYIAGYCNRYLFIGFRFLSFFMSGFRT